MIYTFRVLAPLGSRVSAKDVHLYAENLTPEEELLKLTVKVMPTLARDRGTGRPTKKERREIDSLMDEFSMRTISSYYLFHGNASLIVIIPQIEKITCS